MKIVILNIMGFKNNYKYIKINVILYKDTINKNNNN